jgi:hypothetical protein
MAQITDIAAPGVFARCTALTTRSSRFETTIWLPAIDQRGVRGEGHLLRRQVDRHQERDHACAIALLTASSHALSNPAEKSLSLTVIAA